MHYDVATENVRIKHYNADCFELAGLLLTEFSTESRRYFTSDRRYWPLTGHVWNTFVYDCCFRFSRFGHLSYEIFRACRMVVDTGIRAWACSYKYGELKIKAVRKRVEEAMGEAFDIKEFYDIVLCSNGPIMLVEKQVDHYIESSKVRNLPPEEIMLLGTIFWLALPFELKATFL
ncbi:uncharacterized protein CEXT_202131 [Caerostris extrusa]|uniref:Uncharacterized protein n=1 Tax=Caerostris extrusa TaxID=172846 RepID=A0AAV4T039_CAEEX|nr:uncharacterized protein CEXT_202131 [Caerostris extrusa]